jgi:hypothetical protein
MYPAAPYSGDPGLFCSSFGILVAALFSSLLSCITWHSITYIDCQSFREAFHLVLYLQLGSGS